MLYKKERLYSLDLLKFICSILIVVGHFQGKTHFVWLFDIRSGRAFSSGQLVKLFFMISGFFATNIINQKELISYKEYFLHKLKRIIPMTTIATFVCLVTYVLYLVIYRHYIYGVQLGIWRIVNSFTLTYSGGSLIFEESVINNSLWYICVLLICYSFLYFEVWLKNKLDVNIYTIIFISFFIFLGIKEYGFDLPFFNEITANGYICFSLGIFINKLYYKLRDNKHLFKITFIFSILAIVFSVTAGLFRYDIFFDNPDYIYTFIIFPNLMIIFIYMNQYICNPKLKLLGGISFENYIWHKSFISLMLCLEKLTPELFSSGYTYVHEIVLLITVVSFSTFAHLCIERPIVKYLNSESIIIK